jgi:hypothetical protein
MSESSVQKSISVSDASTEQKLTALTENIIQIHQLQIKQTAFLESIKNKLTFFVVITILAMFIWFISAILP